MHADRAQMRLILAVICASTMAEMALCPRLWLAARTYPPAPAFGILPPLPAAVDAAVFAALMLLLAWIAAAARPHREIAIWLSLAAGYALWDQTRWQPWLYQNAAMLLVLAISYARPDHPSARPLRWMVAAIYIWSGLHKWNSGFVEDVLPWMLEPFGRWLPVKGGPGLAAAAAAMETALGVALLMPRLRKLAVASAVAMHGFILASLGPWGHNFDSVVWPWNLEMIALLLLLFRPGVKEPQGRPAVPVLLFCLLPALSFVDWWDGYLSFSLYSGNNNSAAIYMSDASADRLPDRVQEFVDVPDSGPDELRLSEWSYGELNVPPYAEPRVFREIGRQVCAAVGDPAEMKLIIKHKSTLGRPRREESYDCRQLSRS
jgi:uncharacterized membrane protein YphA (DoxX/SURF4 family)